MICICLCISVIITASDTIDVEIANFQVIYNNKAVNDFLQYPLLSYNDHSYISIRDVGTMLHKKIDWVENENKILITASKTEHETIKKPETALSIGKAIIEEYYGNYVNENSIYHVAMVETTSIWVENYYEVIVLFDPPQDIELTELYLINHPDIEVDISPIDGSFTIIERLTIKSQ